MKKNDMRPTSLSGRGFVKYLIIMKFAVLFFAVSLQAVAGVGNAQSKIDLHLKNATVEQALQAIEMQSTYRFVYKNEILPQSKKITIDVKKAGLNDIMNRVLADTRLTYKITGSNLITIVPAKKEAIRI